MTFDRLGLSKEILRAVHDQGYTSPTPVQEQAIPLVLQGKDLLAGAQTGTGKTAGFALPMLQNLAKKGRQKGRRPIRALVLAPTRELADQVGKSIHTYGKHLGLRSTVIYGGVRFGPQIRALRYGVDILTATPGRLLDHLNQGNLSLSQIEVLVLDEADRMLDMGFIDDIKKVMAAIPPQRQTLLFSATFSKAIRNLANDLLKDPVTVEVARSNAVAETVSQRIFPVPRQRKQALLSHIITEGDWRQVLVFTRTRHGADNLAKALEKDGISSTSIHGEKSQNARNQALRKFKYGKVRALVATDVAARGLDINKLSHVVNFELSHVPEDYVHRIGRTGRAGQHGDAISLVSADERKMLRNIEKLLETKIAQEIVPGFEPDFSMAPRTAKSRDLKRKPRAKSGQKRWETGRSSRDSQKSYSKKTKSSFSKSKRTRQDDGNTTSEAPKSRTVKPKRSKLKPADKPWYQQFRPKKSPRRKAASR